MRKDLSRVKELKKGRKIKDVIADELQRKYWLKEKGLITVSEELRPCITAKSCIKIESQVRTISPEHFIQEQPRKIL